MDAPPPSPVADRRRVYAAVALRSVAVGLVGVLLAFHLQRRGFVGEHVAWAVSAGLLGMVVATAAVASLAARWGVRRALVVLAAVSALGVVTPLLAPSVPVLLAGAFVGLLNGAGRDRGPLPSLDQPALSFTTGDRDRTKVFALYHLIHDAGIAVGPLALFVATTTVPGVGGHVGETGAGDAALEVAGLGLAASLYLLAAVVYARLSPEVAAPSAPRDAGRLSPATRRTTFRLCALFGLDGFGSGLIVVSLLAVIFRERFGVGAGAFALLVFGSRALNALSHLGAAWLARRIGLIPTMVFTHAPSSLLLVTVAFAPSYPVAAVLFLLREGLVEMDVPARTSYVMAIVPPAERTRVFAATNLVRLVAWALAAGVAGFLLRDVGLVVPLACAAACKLLYDGLLWRSFRRVLPPEERDARPGPPAGG